MLEYDVENLKLEVSKLKKEKAALKKENKSYAKRIKELEKAANKRKIRSLAGRAKRKATRVIKKAVSGSKSANNESITAIIPTYRDNGLIYDAVKSVAEQSYPKELTDIIIAFNGSDYDYKRKLEKEFENNSHITVIESPKAGAGAARNAAIAYVKTKYLFFLDDDDLISENYIADSVKRFTDKISVVINRINNYENGEIDTDNYINRAMDKLSKDVITNFAQNSSLFATICGKIYRSEDWKNVYSPIPEDIKNTEDVMFWVNNIDKVKGKIIANRESEEAYIRRVTDNSLSRPSDESLYSFYVEDRLQIIDKCKDKILNSSISLKAKRFIMNIILAQTTHIYDFYKDADTDTQDRIRREIWKSDNVFLNKSRFGDVKGIAFCHNFAPYIDASASVATKRLGQISKHLNTHIDWTVITSDMSMWREADSVFDTFFARQQYTRKTTVGKTRSAKYSQYLWGCAACERAENIEFDDDVQIIYSRTMWLGSHLAARKYKELHPDVKWVAEFSDPLYMTSNNNIRDAEDHSDELSFLNHIYQDTEHEVMKNADQLIFTNENQLFYMLEMNPPEDPEMIDEIRKKALIWNHPKMDAAFSKLVVSDYQLDKSRINIAYFGTFYAARSIGQILTLLDDDRITLHIFTNQNEETEELAGQYKNLVFHDMISQFEMLNLASKMDYCCMSDLDFNGPINPYLPSKLADYLSSGCKIIALVKGNSVLSKIDNRQVLKTEVIDQEFLDKVVNLARGVEPQADDSNETGKTAITVALAADENFALPLLVTVKSLVDSAHDSTVYNVIIMSDGLSESTVSTVNKILRTRNMPACRVIEMGEYYKDVAINIEHTAKPTFFRLQLPDLIEDKKCIYLDTDIVVKDDLTELYNSCSDKYYLAGVKAAAYYNSIRAMESKAKVLGIKALDKYVNAGVLVMNLEKMRKDGLQDVFERLMDKNFSSQDQDVINSACYDAIAIIPPKYNSMTKYANTTSDHYYEDFTLMLCYSISDWKEACENPVIIHYADNRKPWNTTDVQHYEDWHECYRNLKQSFPDVKTI